MDVLLVAGPGSAYAWHIATSSATIKESLNARITKRQGMDHSVPNHAAPRASSRCHVPFPPSCLVRVVESRDPYRWQLWGLCRRSFLASNRFRTVSLDRWSHRFTVKFWLRLPPQARTASHRRRENQTPRKNTNIISFLQRAHHHLSASNSHHSQSRCDGRDHMSLVITVRESCRHLSTERNTRLSAFHSRGDEKKR